MVIAVIGIGGVGGYFGGKLTQILNTNSENKHEIYFYCSIWTCNGERE